MKKQSTFHTASLITAIFLLTFCEAFSQNTWIPKASMPVYPPAAVGFSIGSKGYVGTGGIGNDKSLWEWDQATDVWTQKANFGGPGRAHAVGFSIGAKGYIGTGKMGGTNFNDFWEWDQAANIWTQKANVPGVAREVAVGFSIGAKGYIGTGCNQQSSVWEEDFWEYDPATDVWTQKANAGGGPRSSAVGFSIGAKGYIGTGVTTNYSRDFWEYDPATDAWTQKADFGGMARMWAVGFSIFSRGYIGTGRAANYTAVNDFWEYNPTTNVWTQRADLAGPGRSNAFGFSIGCYGYIGAGDNLKTSPFHKDFLEYHGSTDSSCSCSATATVFSDPSPNTTFCVGQNVYLAASGGTAYVWSTGETDANIAATLSVTTTFSVTVTDAAGCTGTASTTFIVDSNCTATGTGQYNNGSLQSGIWPNPSNGIFTMDMGHGVAADAGMEIYNVFGEKIYQSAVSGRPQTIDISGQPNGIYMLKLTLGKETSFAKIIIRQ